MLSLTHNTANPRVVVASEKWSCKQNRKFSKVFRINWIEIGNARGLQVGAFLHLLNKNLRQDFLDKFFESVASLRTL
jgi:hypothetical protein